MKAKDYIIATIALIASFALVFLILNLAFNKTAENENAETTAESSETEETTQSLPPETTPAKNPLASPEQFYTFVSSQKSNDDANAVIVDNVDEKHIANKRKGIALYTTEEHFELSGLPFNNVNENPFFRLDQTKADTYSAEVQKAASVSAGGRIRFRTNSSTLDINVSLNGYNSAISSLTSNAMGGIDVYTGNGTAKKWLKTADVSNGTAGYTLTVTLPSGMTDVTINLPYYAGVKNVMITFAAGSKIASPTPYEYEKPVLFYGSAATAGMAACRPGTAYAELVTRSLGANLINYGFAEAAKGEQAVAKTIASLEMSAFVLDYDLDASSASELESTHYEFYKTIRDANPELPIIIMSKCNVKINDTDDDALRRKVIKDTYDKAVANGDKNVYFIDGQYVFPENMRDLCWADGANPNDLGHYYIAQALYPVLKAALEG